MSTRHLPDRTPRRHAVLAAFLLAGAVLLSGCTAASQGESVDTSTRGTYTSGLGPVDAATLDSLDQRKADFDGWMFGWRDAGCDAQRASSGDVACATQLSAGHLVAAAVAIEFGSLPDFGMGDETTERVAAVAEAADASGIEWTDRDYPGEIIPACGALTDTFVNKLEMLHDELLRWTR